MTLSLLSVAALLAVASYLQPRLKISEEVPVSADGQELPRTYLQRGTSHQYDAKGELSEIIRMERADHYAGRQESLLQGPRFFSRQADDTTWSASAREGILYPEQEQLLLRDTVTLTNDASGGTLATEEMIIDRRQQIARSRTPVVMTDADNRTEANRMVVNLDTERVRLLGDVRSTLAAPQAGGAR